MDINGDLSGLAQPSPGHVKIDERHKKIGIPFEPSGFPVEILTLSEGPSDWVPMFNALENTGAVWQMADARDKWTSEIKENNDGGN